MHQVQTMGLLKRTWHRGCFICIEHRAGHPKFNDSVTSDKVIFVYFGPYGKSIWVSRAFHRHACWNSSTAKHYSQSPLLTYPLYGIHIIQNSATPPNFFLDIRPAAYIRQFHAPAMPLTSHYPNIK